jgi:hypothetical protein
LIGATFLDEFTFAQEDLKKAETKLYPHQTRAMEFFQNDPKPRLYLR